MFYDKPYFISVPRFSFHQWQCSTHDKFQLTVGANSKLNSHVSTLQKHLRVMSICFPRSPGIVGARRDIVGITFAKPWYGTPFSKPRKNAPFTIDYLAFMDGSFRIKVGEMDFFTWASSWRRKGRRFPWVLSRPPSMPPFWPSPHHCPLLRLHDPEGC